MLDGQPVALAGVADGDSLALRIEALRMHLEHKLGTGPFLKCVPQADVAATAWPGGIAICTVEDWRACGCGVCARACVCGPMKQVLLRDIGVGLAQGAPACLPAWMDARGAHMGWLAWPPQLQR